MIKWNREMVIASAALYGSKSAWKIGDPNAYDAACKRGLLGDEDITGHMEALKTDWTKPMLVESAALYGSKYAWKKDDPNAYNAACKRGLLGDEDITGHMRRPIPISKWTKPMLVESAALYANKSEWRIGDPNTYDNAYKRGWLDDLEITGHMRRPIPISKWTKPMLVASAAFYTSRSAWQTGDPKAYQAACKRGLINDPQITGHMEAQLVYWTREMLIASAVGYTTKVAWEKGDPKAYSTANNRGLINDPQITGHMTSLRTDWTRDAVEASAAKYDTRSEWYRGAVAVYSYAHKRGLINDPQITGHMVNGLKSDNDAIYIWQAVDQHHQGLPVYKIGITSARLDDQRIKEVAKGIRFDFELVILAKVLEKATDIEKALLKLGIDPKYKGFDGASEFRALTDIDLAYALSIITANIDIKHKPKSRAHLTLVA